MCTPSSMLRQPKSFCISRVNAGSDADFVIDGVKFCEDDSIDESGSGGCGEIGQTLIELCQLIHSIVSDKCLSNEEYQIWFIQIDQAGKCTHQGLIVLHTT